jgi:hypothetical protein
LIVIVCEPAFHEIPPKGVVQLYEVPGVRFCADPPPAELSSVVLVSKTGTVPLDVTHGNFGPGDEKAYQKFIWVDVSVGICVKRSGGTAVPPWFTPGPAAKTLSVSHWHGRCVGWFLYVHEPCT